LPKRSHLSPIRDIARLAAEADLSDVAFALEFRLWIARDAPDFMPRRTEMPGQIIAYAAARTRNNNLHS